MPLSEEGNGGATTLGAGFAVSLVSLLGLCRLDGKDSEDADDGEIDLSFDDLLFAWI